MHIKSKNFTIIIGIAFSMLLGPDERLQGCECPVAVWSVISEVHFSSQYTHFVSVLREIQGGRETLIQFSV